MGEHDAAQAEWADSTSPIELELEVAVSRARAWDAYVHGLTEWWLPGSTATGSGLDRITVDPHEGGRIVEHGRDGREVDWGEVTDAVPGERFSHTFTLSHDGDPSTVAVTFVDRPEGGTRVRLTHAGWNDSNRHARSKHEDWPALLERYRAFAQHV
ncbi:MAG: SRPBCC domain-containing protein [Actinomycetota bacterium]